MKIAVITGASSGFGKEFVYTIKEKGLKFDEIWLIARRENRLKEISAEIKSLKFKALALDLTKDADIEKYKTALNKAGADVQLLINNAGYGKHGDFDKMETYDTTGMIDLNCRALTAITNITLPFMSSGAKIINVCSIAAFTPNARMAVYCSTKAYVFSFSKALRAELKSRKINVTAVCPGPMDTEFLPVADITPGASKTFDTLPRVNPKAAAIKTLNAAYKNKGIYTPRFFYKLYRVLSKLLPHGIMMKFAKT